MTDIYIISGFLGAGKTTFIQNLLKQTLQNEKVVIIENHVFQTLIYVENFYELLFISLLIRT